MDETIKDIRATIFALQAREEAAQPDLREALSNAARHAAASQADVTVDVTADGVLTVQVTDNGAGIPSGVGRSGLRNLARRAEKLGSELRVGPADPASPAPGTRLEWRCTGGMKYRSVSRGAGHSGCPG